MSGLAELYTDGQLDGGGRRLVPDNTPKYARKAPAYLLNRSQEKVHVYDLTN